VNPHADARYIQNNILIIQDGQACLGDFGITEAFTGYHSSLHEPETLRYFAPERIKMHRYDADVVGPSKESDIYSLAMTSFSVCTSSGNHPTT